MHLGNKSIWIAVINKSNQNVEYGVKKDNSGFAVIVVTWDIEMGWDILTKYSIANTGQGLVTRAVKRKREKEQFFPLPDIANSESECRICQETL